MIHPGDPQWMRSSNTLGSAVREPSQELCHLPLWLAHLLPLLLDSIRLRKVEVRMLDWLKPSKWAETTFSQLAFQRRIEQPQTEGTVPKLPPLTQIETKSSRQERPKSGSKSGLIIPLNTASAITCPMRPLASSSMTQQRLCSTPMVTT